MKVPIYHPEYSSMVAKWSKYRLTFEGGSDFIDYYLVHMSKRELRSDYIARKRMTYSPSHAKSAIYEIKNSIYQRLTDTIRRGGSNSYKSASNGKDGGVDRNGSTMTGFIGNQILTELLPMGRVGVYVDRQILPDVLSRRDIRGKSPYLYTYKTEDILSWKYDNMNELTNVLLRDHEYTIDKETGLPDGVKYGYRYIEKVDDGIRKVRMDRNGDSEETIVLNMRKIPFIIFQIQESLLTDVADYQISLLNLGSSDVNYAFKSNFPFYTEQTDGRFLTNDLLHGGSVEDSDGDTISTGTSTEANTAKKKELEIGSGQGRRYPKGLDRPAFIHPSSEPLKVSMEKQAEMREEIRQLVRLSVEKLASSSADSKMQDDTSLESGLSYIGMELERCERLIAEIWSDYEHNDNDVVIKYPTNYTIRSDADRIKEAKELVEQIRETPSMELKRQLAKRVAYLLVGTKVNQNVLDKIDSEINSAKVIILDPETIRTDHESGLVGTELASELRGYPKGEVEQAKLDHAERIKRIALAQSSVAIDKLTTDGNKMTTDMIDGARGVDDLDVDNKKAKNEKTLSRQTDLDDTVKDKTRGKANG